MMKIMNNEPKLNVTMEEIASKILEAESILLFPHTHMDGDCLGSSVALCIGLRSIGKKAFVLIEDEIPANLLFLDNGYCTYDYNMIDSPDICMTIDCAEIYRFEKRKNEFLKAKTTMCIDHHSTSKHFADYNYIDPRAAATGELIYKLLKEMSIPINIEMGEAIYAAITTDTGNFQYSNTTKDTLKIVEDLFDIGIDHSRISIEIYQNIRLEKILITSRTLNNMRLYENGRIALACILQKDLLETGATMDESEGIVETIRSISSVDIAILLKEFNNGIVKVSMRSKKDFDVAKFSSKFGGGGHIKAAGFTIKEAIDKSIDIIVSELIKDIKNDK